MPSTIPGGILLEVHRTMIRWTLCYGNDRVTCSVYGDPATSTYRVAVIPNGMASAAITETCTSAVTALERHAAIVSALRARGWQLRAYSDTPATVDRRQRPAA